MFFRRRQAKRRKMLLAALLAILAITLVFMAVRILFSLWGDNENLSFEGDAFKVSLFCHESGETIELGLEEYVAGVVAAEMPASFPSEALKAQAIAARTYAAKRLQVPDPRVKEFDSRADLSSDSRINQAWISTEEMKNRWGAVNYPRFREKIIQAVLETKSLVLVHHGQLIDPVYHSSCGGLGTENSEDVWKYKIPYLRSVPCNFHPRDNKEATNVFSVQELNTRLGINLGAIPAGTGGTGAPVQVREKSPTGRVKSFLVGGKIFSGSEIREKLGLKSTSFSWALKGDRVVVSTRGYGHAVGMCQYGAAALAQNGKDCREILAYYYSGAELASIE